MNDLPTKKIKHLIVTTEHSGYRVTGGIGSYVKECDHLYGDDLGILIVDSNQDVNLEKIVANKWFAAQQFLSPDRIEEILSANFDTVGDLVLEVLSKLLPLYPSIETIEFQEMLANRTIEAKKLGFIPQNIRIITMCHGSSFHLAKAKRDVLDSENVHVAYREKFTIEESDITIFPTQFLRESYRDSGVLNLDGESRIIKRLPFDYKRLPHGRAPEQYKRLLYIGKTSSVKGFDLFLKTLLEIHENFPLLKRQVEQVIVFATSTDIPEKPLQAMFVKLSTLFNIRIISSDREELLTLLAEYSKDSLTLITYTGDNHPLTVLELMAVGHDFLAAKAGGTPELIPAGFSEDYLVEANEVVFAEAVNAAFANVATRSGRIKVLSNKYLDEQKTINEQYSAAALREIPIKPSNRSKVTTPEIQVIVIDSGSKQALDKTLESLKVQTLAPVSIKVIKSDQDNGTTKYKPNLLVMRLYAGDTLHQDALQLMSSLLLADKNTAATLAYEQVPTYLGEELKGVLEFHPFAPELGSVFLQEKYSRRFVGLFRTAYFGDNSFTDWQKCIAAASVGATIRVVPKLLLNLTEIDGYAAADILGRISKMTHSYKALPTFDAFILYSQLKRLDDIYWGTKLHNHLEDIFVRRDDPNILYGVTLSETRAINFYRAKTPKVVKRGIFITARSTYKILERIRRIAKRQASGESS